MKAIRIAANQAAFVRPPDRARRPTTPAGIASSANSRLSAAHARLAAARDVEPEVQQHVVQRRRAVLAQRERDVAERAVGDPDRQALVDPEADPELGRAQQQRERDQRAEPGRDGDPRAGDAPAACRPHAGREA